MDSERSGAEHTPRHIGTEANMDQASISYRDVELDHPTLSTLVNVFEKMIGYPDAIDNSMYDLTSFDKFKALTQKLKDAAEREESVSTIPMSQSEWTTYEVYASHAYDLKDDLTADEVAVMDDINAFKGVIFK